MSRISNKSRRLIATLNIMMFYFARLYAILLLLGTSKTRSSSVITQQTTTFRTTIGPQVIGNPNDYETILISASNQSKHLPVEQLTPSTELPYVTTSRKISKILNDFFDKGYDKRIRPNYGGPPIEVNVTMRILSISSVSEIMMDFTADFYFRQTWNDPRLRFAQTNQISTLYVGAEVSRRIWLPDTFFGNEKTAYFHEATTPNVFLRIHHTGEVYRSIRLTVTSSCAMRLQYFPMDRQQCTIEVESYGYSVRDIIYYWQNSHAVERDTTISLPQFDVTHVEQQNRTERLSTGNYSRLVAKIHFSRRMGYYLIQIYIPSSLIVVISWVSFWLHRNASPARVQLGVTTVLTMTTLMSSTNAALPKISYVKSIDIFLGTCFIMVFAALLEYATVGYLGKRIAMRKTRASDILSRSLALAKQQLALNDNNNMSKRELKRHSSNCAPMCPPTNLTWDQQQQLAASINELQNQQSQQQQQQMQQQIQHEDFSGGDSSPKIFTEQVQQQSTFASNLTCAPIRERNINDINPFLRPAISDQNVHRNCYQSSDQLANYYFANLNMPHGNINRIFGIRPSDVDKYSRVVFPVSFVCFQLMYWVVYLHISAYLDEDV